MFPKEIEKFIQDNLHQSTAKISLKLSKKTTWPKEEIINQINGLQKSKSKFPFLEAYSNFKFPSPRAFSQASSEQTAKFKAQLIQAETIADLSGGMGIDSYFFSRIAKKVSYIEANNTIYEKATFNFKVLKAHNIETYHSTAEDFIINENQFDLIYIDPDRRNKEKRLFLLEDCKPNVLNLLPQLFKISNKILLKLSPIIDLESLFRQLPNISTIWVVAVKNDCKEVLVKLHKDKEQETKINCINLLDEGMEDFQFDYQTEKVSEVSYSKPLNYLYEPNVAIYKAGAFKSIAKKFGLKKLAPNTHLYTSNEKIENFPGRNLKIMAVDKPKKGSQLSASIVSRNFPQTADEIRAKYKISESKDHFLYACRLQDNSKVFIHAERL